MFIKELIKGWAFEMMPNEERQEIAANRYEICNTCEDKDIRYNEEYCKQCGCVLKSKIFHEGANCPINKW
jgi:hypothetical protein